MPVGQSGSTVRSESDCFHTSWRRLANAAAEPLMEGNPWVWFRIEMKVERSGSVAYILALSRAETQPRLIRQQPSCGPDRTREVNLGRIPPSWG